MELSILLIYGLATWRAASLLVNEAGPWDVFLRLRRLTGIEHDGEKQKTIIPDGFLPGVFSCVWCASLWVAGGWVVFDLVIPSVAIKLAAVLALSSLAVLLQRYVGD